MLSRTAESGPVTGHSSTSSIRLWAALSVFISAATVTWGLAPLTARAGRDPHAGPVRGHRMTGAPAAGMADSVVVITYRVTSGNAVGLTLFNTGFFGNNMASRDPSFEYPLGSAEEHMVRGGMWIGGLFSESGELADADTLVSTATIDGYFGSSGTDAESEFSPVSGILERSILPNSRFYDPANARSEQDLICTYIDNHPYGGVEHRPLHVKVTQEILQFSFEPFDAIVIANFAIKNDHPTHPIFDLYAGFYAELASGWKDGFDEWPPSGWFSKKDIAYNDSLHIVTEHHFTLDGGNCPSWAGYQILGTRPIGIEEKHISLNWWNWDPSGNLPETPVDDADRYATLSNRQKRGTAGSEAPRNDPVTLLSVGPLGNASFIDSLGAEHWLLEPGAEVTVAVAFVGGIPTPDSDPPRTAEEDILFNAGWAQTAFNLNYNIPVPPPSPELHIEPAHERITLWWDDSPLGFVDPKSHAKDFEGFRIYISSVGKNLGFSRIGEFDLADSVFYNVGLDEITAPQPLVVVGALGDSTVYPYRYVIHHLRDGFKYWVAVTSFDTGSTDIGSLESGIAQNRIFFIPGPTRAETPDQEVVVFPNPYRGDAAWDEPDPRDRFIWFAGLPERCRLRIFNLAGDLVRTIDFDAGSYAATDVRGIYDPDDTRNPAADIPRLSGHMAAWDLTTRRDQAVASGLYIFSVEDLDSGSVERGKFLILK
jgi:hypothetical protein